MNSQDFQDWIKKTVDGAMETLFAKADGYTDPEGDRLRNFKVAAELQHTTPIKALAGMMAKHTVSVYDLIDKSDTQWINWQVWDEKIGDSINYLLLLSALVHENAYDEEKTNQINLDASGVVELARKDTASEEETLNVLKQYRMKNH